VIDWEEFVGQLGELPRLAGARCRNRWELFDATTRSTRGGPIDDVDYARRAALQLCNYCPALHLCREWFTSLPTNQQPSGVVAGLVNGKKSLWPPTPPT
jgi:hypothetical protein